MNEKKAPPFFEASREAVVAALGKDKLIHALKQMILIRNFETRAEAAYLQGKIGGFFHAYTGQEAIQTAAVDVAGPKNWYSTSYRCHALALLLGASPDELMAELFGRVTGNAKGRGGSMHFYTERLLGGFGIVTGQVPIATGAAFTCKYLNKDEISMTFFGDGAIAQGVFHESLNLASLWNLPCLYVIENNSWGMGTHVSNAVANHQNFSQLAAEAYDMKSYYLDGMDFFNCYAGFKDAVNYIRTRQRPVLIECMTARFKGHSISDPGLYRTKEALKSSIDRDPIVLLKDELIARGMLSEEEFKNFDKEAREKVILSLKFAEESPWGDPITLEDEVYAP